MLQRSTSNWFLRQVAAEGWRRLATAVLITCVVLASGTRAYDALRERAFDTLARPLATPPEAPDPVVVDIDHETLSDVGAWPWPRERLSQLVEAIADARPRALLIDMLLEKPDTQSPAALARQLTTLADPRALHELVEQLTNGRLVDGDGELARQASRVPTVLGVALDPVVAGSRLAAVPILARGRPDIDGLWREPGAIGPADRLAAAGAGLGVLSLPADPDGVLRRVPILIRTHTQLLPGAAVELVRVASGATTLVLSDPPARLTIGEHALPLAPDGMLRLRPGSAERRRGRTISASLLMAPAGRAATSTTTSPTTGIMADRRTAFARRLTDRIVLLGSSAPEAGGLRLTAGAELVAGAQIQADAVTQIMASDALLRPTWARLVEIAATILAGIGGHLFGGRMLPLRGAAATAGASAAWLLLAAASIDMASVLLDPIAPVACAVACYAATALAKAADIARRAAAIRRRFEQHLAPDVVARIVDNPDLLRLDGETRVISVLFTDVEGFTAMTERSEPKALLAVLDRYFEELTRIVIAHGGMVDKIVGDAVHALFNAPLDLTDHPLRATECAIAIRRFAAEFRLTTAPAALGFGRTRIGVETGSAIVGDVGGGGKLDYTAHGNVINTAARLEAANKELGSQICLGPGTAEAVPADGMRPLGAVELRGRSGSQTVFEPWPDDYSATDRDCFRQAQRLAATDPLAAAVRLRQLAECHPDDGALVVFADRLTSKAVAAVAAETTAATAPVPAFVGTAALTGTEP